MLILTQRQSEIVNIDNMETVFVEPEVARFNAGYNIFARGLSGKSVTLGRYKDAARAKEILRDIAEVHEMMMAEVSYEMPSE